MEARQYQPILLMVVVPISDAETTEQANAIAKRLPAYRSILTDYPKDTWSRRYVGTERDKAIGFWLVQIEVRRLRTEELGKLDHVNNSQ